ncbi:MAG: enoyl-CoA hydratase-related protein [bacterium]
MYETIRCELVENTGVLTLARPDVLNAFSLKMFEEILDCMEGMESSGVRACVITGEGRAFSAGADLKERKAMSDRLPPDASPFQRTAHHALSRKVFDTIENLPCPTLAAIGGVAAGGGFELALVCDLRIASQSARLGLTEAKIGAIPSAGGTQRLARLVGLAKAKEIIMLGKLLSAREAERFGLISEVVQDADLMERAMAIARELSEGAPLALRAAKLALNSALDVPLSRGLELERLLAALLSGTQDLEEGKRAFAEKRKPEFRGK